MFQNLLRCRLYMPSQVHFVTQLDVSGNQNLHLVHVHAR